jgi:hypothetical protein
MKWPRLMGCKPAGPRRPSSTGCDAMQRAATFCDGTAHRVRLPGEDSLEGAFYVGGLQPSARALSVTASTAPADLCAAAEPCCAVNPLSTSVVPEIGTLRSVGAGGGSSPLATRWMWKRSYGKGTWAPPDERGGNRQTEPTATAPHLDSTASAVCVCSCLLAVDSRTRSMNVRALNGRCLRSG